MKWSRLGGLRVIFLFYLANILSSLNPIIAQDIDLPISVWLMNNEAKAFSLLSADRVIIEKISMPFGIMAFPPVKNPAPEESLWEIHNGFYKQLPGINKIYQLANRFGSEKFRKLFVSARPGRWITLTLLGAFPASKIMGVTFDKTFRDSFQNIIGVQKLEDMELDKRLQRILDAIPDSDRKILLRYLDTFQALYPENKLNNVLSDLIKMGLKKESSKGFTMLANEILNEETGTVKRASATAGLVSDFETSFDSATSSADLSEAKIDLTPESEAEASGTPVSDMGENASPPAEDIFKVF